MPAANAKDKNKKNPTPSLCLLIENWISSSWDKPKCQEGKEILDPRDLQQKSIWS